MISIEYEANYEKFDKIIDNLLSEYDTENNVDYNIKYFTFTAKKNNIILGYLNGYAYYAEIVINNLVVLKNYRKLGIGTKLIRHTEKYFTGKGYNNINLVTNEFQAPLFYKKCGFKLEFIRKNLNNPKLNKYFFIKYF